MNMKMHFASASCPTCDTLFERLPVEYDEDGGYAFLEVRPCAGPTCGKMLCSCCDQFHCDGCGQTFCATTWSQYRTEPTNRFIAARRAQSNASFLRCLLGFRQHLRCARFFRRRRPDMARLCEWCGESIAFLDAQTSSGNAAWHTRCWNRASEQRAAYIAACEDSEGFVRRFLPDELSKSETGRRYFQSWQQPPHPTMQELHAKLSFVA